MLNNFQLSANPATPAVTITWDRGSAPTDLAPSETASFTYHYLLESCDFTAGGSWTVNSRTTRVQATVVVDGTSVEKTTGASTCSANTQCDNSP
jgi:hypothetical protein